MALDKVKRQFIWLRQVLELIDKTTLPGEVLGEIRVGMELFGWDRLPEVISVNNVGAAATNQVVSAVVPAQFLRLCLAAQVVSSDVAIQQRLWIAQRGVLGGQFDVGVSSPIDQAIGEAGIPAVVEKSLYMSQGERLVGRSVPAPGVGEELTLTFRHIDLPLGEYIPYL